MAGAGTSTRQEPEDDTRWMACALALAGQGVGLASPNPTVGCVLVHGDAIAGRGFHQYQFRDHAEVVALQHAGEQARGATAYITLEPCSHFGRTPPCANALIEAGVRRVVVATADPNPAVNGKGIALLRAAGVSVSVGTLEAEARTLNNAFARFIRTRLPFVTLKAASTLDGRIAPGSQHGHPFPITGKAARAEVQLLRHAHDALLTGVGTVLADDPLLTDRSHCPRRRPLLRVVLDSQLRLPLTSRLLAEVNDDLLIVTHSAGTARGRELEARGARLLALDTQGEGGISLRALLGKLGEGNVTSLLIEGGARLNRSALLSDAADRLFLFFAPFFLGSEGVPLLAPGLETRWPRLPSPQLHTFGEDFAVESLLRDPWA